MGALADLHVTSCDVMQIQFSKIEPDRFYFGAKMKTPRVFHRVVKNAP